MQAIENCVDKCTLDGLRRSICEYECDPATGTCSNKCDGWSFAADTAAGRYNSTCVARMVRSLSFQPR